MASSTASRKRSGFSPRRSAGGGAGEDAAGHELGDRADGAELLEGAAVAAEGHVVDLEHLAGGLGPVAGLPALRPAPVEAASALGLEAPLAEGRGLDPPVGDGLAEDAADGGHGQVDAVPGQHRLQLGLAHVGALLPQLDHGLVVGVRPAPPLDGAGARAPWLERPDSVSSTHRRLQDCGQACNSFMLRLLVHWLNQACLSRRRPPHPVSSWA